MEEQIKKNLDSVQQIYHPAMQFSRECFVAYAKLFVLLVSLFDKAVFQKTLRTHKEKVISFLNEFSEQTPAAQ